MVGVHDEQSLKIVRTSFKALAFAASTGSASLIVPPWQHLVDPVDLVIGNASKPTK